MSDDAPRKAPLTIRQDGRGKPSVLLNGMELRGLLTRDGGLKIEYAPLYGDGPSAPRVTMVFAAGALDFDFDVDLLLALLDAAERQGESA